MLTIRICSLLKILTKHLRNDRHRNFLQVCADVQMCLLFVFLCYSNTPFNFCNVFLMTTLMFYLHFVVDRIEGNTTPVAIADVDMFQVSDDVRIG